MGNTFRADGTSTRMADQYIQDLFNNGKIHVQDHYDGRAAHEHLFHIIMRRLEMEHGSRINFIANKSKLTIAIDR